MWRYVVLLVGISVLFPIPITGELFTAVVELQKMYTSERKFAAEIKQFVLDERNRLNDLLL